METLKHIQEMYSQICRRHNTITPRVYFKPDLEFKGLYIEVPFPKIYLNPDCFTYRTIFHELFHHLNPNLNDGEEFERQLDHFIKINLE